MEPDRTRRLAAVAALATVLLAGNGHAQQDAPVEAERTFQGQREDLHCIIGLTDELATVLTAASAHQFGFDRGDDWTVTVPEIADPDSVAPVVNDLHGQFAALFSRHEACLAHYFSCADQANTSNCLYQNLQTIAYDSAPSLEALQGVLQLVMRGDDFQSTERSDGGIAFALIARVDRSNRSPQLDELRGQIADLHHDLTLMSDALAALREGPTTVQTGGSADNQTATNTNVDPGNADTHVVNVADNDTQQTFGTHSTGWLDGVLGMAMWIVLIIGLPCLGALILYVALAFRTRLRPAPAEGSGDDPDGPPALLYDLLKRQYALLEWMKNWMQRHEPTLQRLAKPTAPTTKITKDRWDGMTERRVAERRTPTKPRFPTENQILDHFNQVFKGGRPYEQKFLELFNPGYAKRAAPGHDTRDPGRRRVNQTILAPAEKGAEFLTIQVDEDRYAVLPATSILDNLSSLAALDGNRLVDIFDRIYDVKFNDRPTRIPDLCFARHSRSGDFTIIERGTFCSDETGPKNHG